MTNPKSSVYRLGFRLGKVWFYTHPYLADTDESAIDVADEMIDQPGYHFYGAKLERCTNHTPPYKWEEVGDGTD